MRILIHADPDPQPCPPVPKKLKQKILKRKMYTETLFELKTAVPCSGARTGTCGC